MADESYPADLRYHVEHDWARVDGDTATFGITWFAQDNLQEIVFFDAPSVGDRVTKDQVVKRGDVIVTSGFRSGDLTSLYPRGLPIGAVTSVGQTDTDLYKQIQIDSFVDFSKLEAVIVLVKKPEAK